MRAIAERLSAELRPYCERIEIAGSVRRAKPACSDIELVCVPRITIERKREGDLFRIDQAVTWLDDHVAGDAHFEDRMDKNGRGAWGPRYKRLLVDGIALDLFSVLWPASWGVVFLIRTGPLEFSRRMVTPRRNGGALPDDCRVEEGAVWSVNEIGLRCGRVPLRERPCDAASRPTTADRQPVRESVPHRPRRIAR